MSTPSVRAASRKSSVRYVVVGRRRSSRSMGGPADDGGGLRLAGAVVGVGARRVVGGVQHLGHLGKLLLDEALDPRLQRDVGGAAALAASTHLQVDPVVLHVDQLDEAAVTGDGRVDHRVDQVLHLGLEIVAHGITSQTGSVLTVSPPAKDRANWPWVGSAQQNHGSVSLGGRGRPLARATEGGAPTPAAAAASPRTRSKVRPASSSCSAAAVTAAATASARRSTRGSGCVQRWWKPPGTSPPRYGVIAGSSSSSEPGGTSSRMPYCTGSTWSTRPSPARNSSHSR